MVLHESNLKKIKGKERKINKITIFRIYYNADTILLGV